jgi:hypothetical protein
VAEAELEEPEESPRLETTGWTEELDAGERGSDPAMAEGEGSRKKGGGEGRGEEPEPGRPPGRGGRRGRSGQRRARGRSGSLPYLQETSTS